MGLYAFGIVSKRPFYFFGAPRFRVSFVRILFSTMISMRSLLKMLCVCIGFPFLLLTFDVALRYLSGSVRKAVIDGLPAANLEGTFFGAARTHIARAFFRSFCVVIF